jgi:hypothetical protein
MFIKKLHCAFFIMLLSLTTYAQNISIKSTQNLSIKHQIIEIKEAKTIMVNHEPQIVVLANIRLPKYRVGVALMLFDLNGKLVKEQLFDNEKYNYKAASIIQKEGHYYLLLNRMETANNRKSMLLFSTVGGSPDVSTFPIFYEEDERTSVITTENLFEGTSMIVNNGVFITASIIDEKDNLYPILIGHNIITKRTESILTFDKKNDFEAIEKEAAEIDNTSKIRVNQNGKVQYLTEAEMIEKGITTKEKQIAKVPPLLKECKKIKLTETNEILLVGQQNSINNSDFWVTKMIYNQDGFDIVWEDIYKSKYGGDEGHDIYKTKNGYLVFGLDYTKRIDSYYSYRVVALDENGQETANQKFNSGGKDWFKGVVEIGGEQQQFLLFGQTQTVTLPKSMFEEETINTSNLWMILVDENGEKMSELMQETETLEEAILLGKISDDTVFGLYLSDENLKMIMISTNNP